MNATFDIPYVEKRAKVLGINIRDLWSDPEVPRHLRKYWFEEGRDSALTEDGKFTKIQFEDRWHTVHCTASFQILDAMCTYRRLRTQQPRLPSYALDAILKREKLPGKVSIPGCEGYKKLALHIFQQQHKKLDYIIYGGGDAWETLALDAVTLDMQLTLPTFQGHAPFSLAAKPSKMSDITSYFWNMENHNQVLGVATYLNKDDVEAVKKDKLLNQQLSTSNWIVTVDAWKTTLNGSKCLLEDPNRITNIRLFGFDEDVTSSYPSGYVATNGCKETCRTEVIKLTDTRDNNWRATNLNSLSGRVNSLENGIQLFGLPTPEETIDLIEKLGL